MEDYEQMSNHSVHLKVANSLESNFLNVPKFKTQNTFTFFNQQHKHFKEKGTESTQKLNEVKSTQKKNFKDSNESVT